MEKKNNILFYVIFCFFYTILIRIIINYDFVINYIFLTPITFLVSMIANLDFTFINGTGFVNYDLNIIVDKSCAGINFFLLTLIFSFVILVNSKIKILRFFYIVLFSTVSAYFVAILSNLVRIILSIKVKIIRFEINWFSQTHWFHYALGIVVFLSFLIGYYLILERYKKWIIKTNKN
ncbi:MAG: exosortase K [Spirochaetes bacterium GWD1_27_9]|nr:MAG: exosortase K [Spirochaetes bacterium GWB1_27_13]OHD38636.1 MAG: exosortase K [Spirochaetes bacterium GWD1_27_9]